MKLIQRTLCFAALALTFGLPASAAERANAARKPHSPAVGEARHSSHPAVVKDDDRNEDMLGQVVFEVLLAEIALQRGDPVFASKAYADLALRTRDPQILERTIEVAGYARRPDLALETARLWAQVDPNSLKARQVLAGAMIMAGQLDGLAPNLIRVLEADPASLAQNLLGLSRLLARNPDHMAVFRLIEQVGRHFLDIPEAHYAVAVAASLAGEKTRALEEARWALDLRPDWERAAVLQGQLLSRENPEEAISFMREFLERYPEARELRLHLARVLVGEKRYDEARRQFGQLLEKNPDNPEVVYPVAILALRQNDLDFAETQLEHLLTLNVADKSYAYFFLGQIAEERKRKEAALSWYAQIDGGERYLAARIRSAHLLAGEGRLDEARKLLDTAKTSSTEERIQMLIAEAALLRGAKQTEAAYSLLDSALHQHPDQPDLLYETALLADKLGKIDVLESRLRRLIELRPESAQAYNALGYSFADRGMRLGEARDLIEKALALSPDEAFILDSMGWVLYRQSDLSGALAYLEKAYAKRDDPEIAAHLGEVLWALGRQDEAKRVWLEAKNKNPDSEPLAETIKKFLP